MGASTAIDPALTGRFAKALGRLNPDGGKIGLAVSGGPDSMAMLLLAQEAIPGAFEVATVDHGLRPEAKDECALVVAACEERGVPCEVLQALIVTPGNLPNAARMGRYFALGEWAEERSICCVATAHHADDQVETLLMRLNRSSGVAGLAGVRENGWIDVWPEIGLIRPLLGFRRSELAAVCEVLGVQVATDPSNEDDRYDRARLRKAIAGEDWLDPIAISSSASYLADADEALQSFTNILWGERVTLRDWDTSDGRSYVLKPMNGREMNRRLVANIFTNFGSHPRGSEILTLLERLERGENANLAGVLASVEGDDWVFRPEPPRRTN